MAADFEFVDIAPCFINFSYTAISLLLLQNRIAVYPMISL